METSEIEKSLIIFLKKNILSDGVNINSDSSLRDVGIDSFSIVEIILFIERKYGLVIPDKHLLPENFINIKSIALLINNLGK
jgi:acyl carrier protein